MTTKKSLPIVYLTAALATICLHAEYLNAQSPLATKWREPSEPPPAPVEASTRKLAVTAATPGPVPSRHPRATFTFADGRQFTSRTPTGRFRLVGLRPSEIVDIALQFPAALPGNSVTAQSLDGGNLLSFSINNPAVGGLASIRFQAGAQPGLYRLVVPGLGAPSLLQFWVADPGNSRANPSVVNPAD